MKKSTKIAIIVISIVAVIIIAGVILISFLFSTLLKDKASITASDFYTTMSQKGYLVQPIDIGSSDYADVKEAYVANSKDYGYKIEFYEVTDDNFTGMYSSNKAFFESSKGAVSAETNVAVKNYAKYTLSSNGKYMVVSRINNTIIYINADDQYRDNIKAVLNEIGY